MTIPTFIPSIQRLHGRYRAHAMTLRSLRPLRPLCEINDNPYVYTQHTEIARPLSRPYNDVKVSAPSASSVRDKYNPRTRYPTVYVRRWALYSLADTTLPRNAAKSTRRIVSSDNT